MKSVLHTFRKDFRHLWPAALVSLVLLATLARADRWRSDTMVSSTEGWLNLVLPLAWACVIALAVLEEPLAGDRHFWLTRPHRWPALLTAKVLFALLFVHVPFLIADGYILAAHGFPPLEYLPQLLWKQLSFAAFVTLPALALATLVRSFTHFMLGIFAIAATAAFAFVSGAARTANTMPRPDDYLRGEITAILIAAAAVVILWFQYRRRQAIIARTVVVVVALLAGTLIGYVPELANYQARAVLRPIYAPLSLRIIEPPSHPPEAYFPFANRSTVVLPVALTGLPVGVSYRTDVLTLTVAAGDGRRYQSTTSTPGNQFEKVQLEASLFPYKYDSDSAFLWLTLRFDAAVYAALKDGAVRLTGRSVVRLVRPGETAWMPVGGRVAAPGVGHCTSGISEDRWSEARIKVLCESPSDIPAAVRVTLWTPEDGRRFTSRLGAFGNPTTGPQTAWLSPLDRGKTFFNLSDPKYRRYPVTVEVPMEHLANARIAVTPEFVTGYSVVNFDFPDIPLSKYWIEPRKLR
jgi:hypothetical protein